jgi:hypothetical protein
MSEKIYFGTGPLPKGYRRPTMKESVDASQVRFYGLHKIDSRLISNVGKRKPASQNRDKLGHRMIVLRGRVKNLRSKISFEKDNTKALALQDEMIKARDELDKVRKLFNAADKPKSKKSTTSKKSLQVVEPKKHVTKKVKSVSIPIVDPSVYDKEAEDLYNRTELQKDEVRKVIAEMKKLQKK